MKSKDLPWGNSKEWKQGYWYPLCISHDVEFKGKEVNVESATWDLFRLDPKFKPGDKLFGDIECMDLYLNFYEAVKSANKLKQEKLWTFSWAKELE